jgi:hypothetical protein
MTEKKLASVDRIRAITEKAIPTVELNVNGIIKRGANM